MQIARELAQSEDSKESEEGGAKALLLKVVRKGKAEYQRVSTVSFPKAGLAVGEEDIDFTMI